jgi:Icc-related predicted phosphoesterase
MTSRIYLASDLHHEMWGLDGPIEVPGTANIVVIAGDLEYMPKALEICGKTADRTELPVVFVPGNHEYYRRDYQAMNELANIYEHENVHVLINRSVIIEGIRFLGTPLWTNFLALGEETREVYMETAERYINDFRVIKCNGHPVTAEVMLGWHLEARRFLEEELSKPHDGRTVVVTHFPPSYELCHDMFIGERLSPYFNANCDALIKKYQPDAWFYGHTHTAVEKKIHSVPMFCNMGGYPNERQEITGFDPNRLINL